MDAIRAVVTGGGSIVGQGIIKSLRLSKLPVHIISTDIAPLNTGLFRADEGHVITPVEAPGALEEWEKALKSLSAHILLIGSEFDLRFFSTHARHLEQTTGCKIIASPPEVVDLANDKMETASFLARHGLPHGRAVRPADLADARSHVDELGWPFVLKPCSGTSSRYVNVIHDEESLGYWFPRTPSPMLQEFLKGADDGIGSEYSCSVFRAADGTLLGPFISRRTLRGGSSWVVEICHSAEIAVLMLDIGRRLPSVGSLNVQLIKTSHGPVPFEFNARFSGTTPIRAHFGFNEPEMAIRNYLLGEALPVPEIRQGLCLRYIEEIMIEGANARSAFAPIPKGIRNNWF